MNSPYQLEEFLAYWLNYFVFSSPLKDGIHSFVFPMVMSLAQGKKLGLALWYLGTFYARLGMITWQHFPQRWRMARP